MSAPALFNLLNSLQKGNKMLGKPRISSLFLNLFNKFNNTGAFMLDPLSKLSIFHPTQKLK